MKYQKFLNALSEEIRHQALFGTEVRFVCVPKNNGVKKDAVSVLTPGYRGAAQLFYTEDCYHQFLAGKPVKALASDLLQASGKTSYLSGVSEEQLSDFAQLREKICFRLVNLRMNLAYLREVPFYPFLDLAAVYYYSPSCERPDDAVIAVKRTDLDRWGVTAEELHALAMKNTPRLHPLCCVPIETVIDRICDREKRESGSGPEASSPEEAQGTGLWVLTNKSQLFGASAMLYPDSFRPLSERLGRDLFILPSSIHEVLILPDTGAWSARELTDMVREINRTQLLPEEVLADGVYRYDDKTGQIRRV